MLKKSSVHTFDDADLKKVSSFIFNHKQEKVCLVKSNLTFEKFTTDIWNFEFLKVTLFIPQQGKGFIVLRNAPVLNAKNTLVILQNCVHFCTCHTESEDKQNRLLTH